MGFLKDTLAVFKKRDLALLESRKEAEDIYTFLFEKDDDLVWKAGQHGLFTIAHKKIKNGTRPFTIASSPGENTVRVTTRISGNPSDFKKAMLELKKGTAIRMSGPAGSFHLEGNRPSLLIAGGIGITPFRSMLKQLEAEGKKDAQHIHLIYQDSEKSYILKDELDEIAASTSASIAYVDSREVVRAEIDKFAAANGSNGEYFIAGPTSMVDSLSDYMRSKGISKRNIKKDSFYGYQ